MRRPSPPLAVVYVLGAMLLLGVLTSCGRDDGLADGRRPTDVAPVSAEESPVAGQLPADGGTDGEPVLAVSVESIDFGRIEQTQIVESNLSVRNGGDGDLLITRISST